MFRFWPMKVALLICFLMAFIKHTPRQQELQMIQSRAQVSLVLVSELKPENCQVEHEGTCEEMVSQLEKIIKASKTLHVYENSRPYLFGFLVLLMGASGSQWLQIRQLKQQIEK